MLDPSKGGIHTEDIIKVLEGHILDGYKVSPHSCPVYMIDFCGINFFTDLKQLLLYGKVGYSERFFKTGSIIFNVVKHEFTVSCDHDHLQSYCAYSGLLN